MDLLRVLGCGVEVKDKRMKNLGTFDLENLNWSKVIICTDADVDGYHIRTLILTMLYRLVPTLIDEGYVYIAESPLYEINCKEKTYFAYTEPREEQHSEGNRRPEVLDQPLEGSWRERPRHDVAHHHEPRNAPLDQGGA